MVDPFTSRSFDIPDPVTAPRGAATVEYSFVNDYGGTEKATASVSSEP
jgi:P pilus assembly chaperone PapD